MVDNREYGLVLAGGGTKGAYQVGVWKALKELNINVKGIVEPLSWEVLNKKNKKWCFADRLRNYLITTK